MKKKNSKIQFVRRLLLVGFLTLLLSGMIDRSFLFVLLMILIALLTGAFFCGWLCPFGALQELMGNMAWKLKLPRLRIPAGMERFLRLFRYLLLALSITGLGFILFLSTPHTTFLAELEGSIRYVTRGAWILMGFFILLSLFIDRPFCRYFCTEGAQYGLLSMGRLFSIRRNKEDCINCGLCDRSCPMQIEISKCSHVRNPQCNNCFQCLEKCPRPGALRYGWVLKKRTQVTGVKHEKAIEIIRSQKGLQFDPDIVASFLRVSDQIKEIHQNLSDDLRQAK